MVVGAIIVKFLNRRLFYALMISKDISLNLQCINRKDIAVVIKEWKLKRKRHFIEGTKISHEENVKV
jgi:hypothetical protein